MGEGASVVLAVVVVAVVAGLVASRLHRVARGGRAEGLPTTPAEDPTARLSTADQRFRLLSFQGGAVPADLGPLCEELRRNGIQVDEATLRRKLAAGATTFAEIDRAQMDGGQAERTQVERTQVEATQVEATQVDLDAVRKRGAHGTAIVVSATDVPGGGEAAPGTVLVQVTLELPIPGREAVRKRWVTVVTDDRRALLETGAAVPVRYDPADPRALVLEWEIT